MSGNTFGSTTEEEEEEEPIACTEEAASTTPLVCKPPELDAKYVSESTENALLRADYKFTTTKSTSKSFLILGGNKFKDSTSRYKRSKPIETPTPLIFFEPNFSVKLS